MVGLTKDEFANVSGCEVFREFLERAMEPIYYSELLLLFLLLELFPFLFQLAIRLDADAVASTYNRVIFSR